MTNKILPLFLCAAALTAGAYEYESPAAAIARAEAAGDPARAGTAAAYADAGWLACYGQNDYARARDYFERALALEPTLPRALEGYGRTLEIGGDYDGALRAYLAFLAAAPDHPAALSYAHRCHVLEEDTNARDAFLAAMEGLRARTDAPPRLRAKATFYLFDRAHRAGDVTHADALLATLNPVRAWMTIGPFDNEGKRGFAAVYPPVQGFVADATYDGKARPVRWRTLPAPLPTGFLDLTTIYEPATNGVAYLAVTVNSPAAREVSFVFGAGGAVKIWLNGAPIFAADAYHEGYVDQYEAPAPLAAGPNLLLVKICGDDARWSFGGRFAAENGEPLTDVTFAAEPAAIAAAARTPARGGRPPAEPGFFGARIAAGNADAFDYFYAALDHGARADADEHEELPTKLLLAALAAMPGAADFHYYAAITEQQQSRVFAGLTRATGLAPAHLQAQLELAKYYYGLGRPRDALAALDRVLGANPRLAEAAQYRAKIYWEEGWAYDADRAAAALTAQLPAYPYSKMVRANFAKNYGDLAAAAALWCEIYDADLYAAVARDELYSLRLYAGDVDGAAATMRRYLAVDPYDRDARYKLATAFAAYGRGDEALAAVAEGLRFRPEDYELWRLRGETLDRMGRTEAAKEAYKTAITLKKNYPALENYLSYLEPGRGGGRDAQRLDAYDLVAAYPGDGAFPRDSAVWLLHDKYVEVFDNGTSSRTEHVVIKVLTSEGADKCRVMYINFAPGYEEVELKRAAVLKPDGAELTATQIEDYNAFDVGSRLYYSYVNRAVTMPNLTPGDVIDFEYRISETGTNLFADYFGDYFYFGDKNSTLRARYTLDVPTSKEYHLRRIRGAPAATVERNGDRLVYRFEMRDLGPVEEEAFMPALAELLPAVQVSTFDSWDEVGRWYNGLIKDVFRPSPETETLARELVRDAPDDLSAMISIYDFAVTKIRYVGLEFGIGGYRPHPPKQCLETLYGDCKDKATLMNTLFRLLGFRAYPVLVRTADLGEMDYPLPLLGLFNHMVSYVELPDGRSFFLDGTAAYHGYRELPGPDQGLNVLVLFDDRAEFKRTPVLSPDDNRLTAATVIRLGPNGVGAVHRTVSYGAKDAGAQRFRFHVPEKRRAVIEEYWNGLYPGTEVFHETFSNLADLSVPVRVEYDATVPRLYDPAAAKVQLDAIIQPSSLAGLYGKKASRRWPLVIPENEKEVSELTYVLPPEYVVAALPLTKELRTRFGTFRLEAVATPGQVTVRQDLELYAQRIAPDDYPAFREFCLNVDDWEGEPIQLEKTP